ncbi:hypothetical protein [Agrobacterium sp. RAC06]|uniref:hypothetical protein n=1 Tax=Agrobacterium sp. RAC06 TaxID=1842536 RepID=UPI00083E0F5F|nr:hypothetical protein [Agrobacterium sp. RAC06]AOG12551.1 hypothetical protein BSY240_4669 [Agrobacterium sp. RAC06]
MTADQIPEFVAEILATGCPIYALGRSTYVIAEFVLPEELSESVSDEVNAICERYGDRSHLQLEIAAYLRSIDHWIEDPSEILH